MHLLHCLSGEEWQLVEGYMLLVAWKLVAPCECRRNYTLTSVLVLYFGGSEMEKPPGKKCCTVEEKKRFQEKWVNSHFVRPRGTDKAICLICTQAISVLKEFNVKHHHETNQKSLFLCNLQSYAVSPSHQNFEILCFSHFWCYIVIVISWTR